MLVKTVLLITSIENHKIAFMPHLYFNLGKYFSSKSLILTTNRSESTVNLPQTVINETLYYTGSKVRYYNLNIYFFIITIVIFNATTKKYKHLRLQVHNLFYKYLAISVIKLSY